MESGILNKRESSWLVDVLYMNRSTVTPESILKVRLLLPVGVWVFLVSSTHTINLKLLGKVLRDSHVGTLWLPHCCTSSASSLGNHQKMVARHSVPLTLGCEIQRGLKLREITHWHLSV